MRRTGQVDRLRAAINDAWLGKVELDLGFAQELVTALEVLETVAHHARDLQLGATDDIRFAAAWDLSHVLNTYFGVVR